MAEGAVLFLLERVKELGSEIYKLHRDAEKARDALEKNLELLEAKLERAAASTNVSSEKDFKVLENQIREFVYKTEDLIEDFVTHKFAGSTPISYHVNRIDLAAKLKEFGEELELFLKNDYIKEFPRVPSSSSTLTQSDYETRKRRHEFPLKDKTVVGFEDAIEELIGNVRNDDIQGVEVISITGMAGLGKTTVAWKIFRDPRIEHEFPTRIWVVVSEEYKAKNIYLTILKNFTSQDLSRMSETDLAKKSEHFLSQVKFLLVVDDVWHNIAWDDIKMALPSKGSGKVLMTSRHDNVATHAKTHKPPHKLRCLTPGESWKLLQYEVYGNETEWPSNSETVGVKISEKCGGLPLAIVVIGGILKEKTCPEESRKEEWSKVADRTEEYILEKDGEKRLIKFIALSYDRVPYSLRYCLLYFGVYPNNMEICVWKLTCLWIAEGFIKAYPGQTLEEVAVGNLMELIRRNLVMVGERNHRGEVKTCRVHDMIREYCKKRAMEENFFLLISKPSTTFNPDVQKIDACHRISIHSEGLKFIKGKPKAPRARSFLCFSKHEIDIHPSSLRSIVDAFDRIRILEVGLIKFPKYDSKLTKLNHLRYISLAAGENFKSLPATIAQLRNLQTIVIDTSHHTFHIKADVVELKRLRHVKSKAGIVFTCGRMGESNNNIQTLDRLSTESCKHEELLSKTPKIQTLGVCGDLRSLVHSTCFTNLKHLTKMKMIKVSEMSLDGFVADANFPPNLKILTLSATNLDWIYMRTLGRLPLLEVLKLKDNAFVGDEWSVSPGEFPNLQYLHIDRSNLLMWFALEGSLSKVKNLLLYNCERLRVVPISLAKTLEMLEMGLVTRDVRSSVDKIVNEKTVRKWVELNLKIAPGT